MGLGLLPNAAVSSLLKCKAKLLLRREYLSCRIMCVAEHSTHWALFGSLLVFESQVLCQRYKKIVNKWPLKLKTLKPITHNAQKTRSANWAELITCEVGRLSLHSQWNIRQGTHAAGTSELLHIKGPSADWSVTVWGWQQLKGREKLQKF